MKALAVAVLGVACGAFLLPARLLFTPRSGHRGLLGSAALAGVGDGFAGGRSLLIRMPAPDPDAGLLALRVKLRRSVYPVRVRVDRDGASIAEFEIPPRTGWLEIPLAPTTGSVRLQVQDDRQVFETLYLVERVELRRRVGPRRLALLLLPGLIGAFVASRPFRSSVVACLWGTLAALASAGLLAAAVDPAALLQFDPTVWRAGTVALGLSAALLLLVPRLLERPALEPGPRLRPSHVIGAALLIASGVLVAAGLFVKSQAALGLAFGQRALQDADLLVRAGLSGQVLLAAAAAALYLAVLAAIEPRLDRLSERRLNLSVAAILTLSLLGASEGALAPRFPPVYWPTDPNAWARRTRAPFLADRELGHVLNPESENPYRINESGLRGASFPRVKPAGEWRLATLGDSIPFGTDLGEDEPYAVRLEELLRRRAMEGRSYRVLNAGVPAYDSLQTFRAFRRVVLPLAPDVVIVTVGWNDLAWSLGSGWFPERSIAYRWHPPRFRPALLRFAQELAVPATLDRSEPDPRALRAYHENLAALAGAARGAGVRMLLTNLPTILSAAGNTEQELSIARGKRNFAWKVEHVRRFQAEIDAVCGAQPELLCVRDVFPLEERGKADYFLDHCHPNAAGHARIAERLLRALAERGWL